VEAINKVRKSIKKRLAKGFLIIELLNNAVLEKFRLDTCLKCPKYDPDKDECKACGCIIELKVKTKTNRNPNKGDFHELRKGGRIEKTHCPEGRWLDKETADYYAKE